MDVSDERQRVLTHLAQRAALRRAVRRFFEEREFLEVETPQLSADTVVDRHIEPIRVLVPGAKHGLWLQTSPEFAMKRLLALGAEAIFQITHAFRADERGRFHNPEFTLVEWYRVGDRPEDAMQLLSDLADTTLSRGPAERLSYGEAFQRHVGLDPHRAEVARLRQAAEARGIVVATASDCDRDFWLNVLLSECVEPQLGHGCPTLLYDYPASQAALAQVRDGDPPVAERFELYVAGIELANGYHELLDPSVLRARNRITNELRVADGKCRLPEESRLLDALESGLPPSCGVALGFDRLVMLAVGAANIDQVMAFPIEVA